MDFKERVKNLLARNVVEVIERAHLERRLLAGEKLCVKFGVDPTSPDLHLGHAVVFHKLREFQDLGCKAVLIIGDFTAKIGDPSGRDKTRPTLSDEEIKKNMKDYLAQASKVIDIKSAEIRYNSSWLGKLKSEEILHLLSLMTAQQILEREDFSARLKEQKSIQMHELFYPILQAYDSVVVKADVELGGTDQTFNLLIGRSLMEKLGMPPQDILTLPLLVGTDGERKMSKSYGNYIALNDTPEDMFGKVMSVPDKLVEQYFMLCTDVADSEFRKLQRELSPRNLKARLGFEVVKVYYGEEAARVAEDDFNRKYAKKGMPITADEYIVSNEGGAKDIGYSIVKLIADIGKSRNISDFNSMTKARRKVQEGSVYERYEENGKVISRKINDSKHLFVPGGGKVLQVGRRFFRIIEKK